MPTLLHIDSSPRTTQSDSRMLSHEFVVAYHAALSDCTVVYRDLAVHQPSLVDERWINASFTPPELRTPDMSDALRESDMLIDELLAADVLVISTPMHNFGISTLLKCYIDQVLRVGRTLAFTPNGPQGLVQGKRAVVVATRGSDYSGPMAPLDFQEPYLRTLLSFIGITNVTCLTCNDMHASSRARTLEQTRQAIPVIVAQLCDTQLELLLASRVAV